MQSKYTTNELAALWEKPASTILRWADNEKWSGEKRKGRGGGMVWYVCTMPEARRVNLQLRHSCRSAVEDYGTQSSGLLGFGLLNTFIDLANHVGQSVNDYGLGALFRPRTYLPGICRALTADTGGQVIATRCYRNRRWIFIDGCDPLIGRDKARAIVAHIEAACADMRPFLGTTLTDFFDTITA